MDSLVSIPRAAAASLALIRTQAPEDHPSSEMLGEERTGRSGVAVSPNQILTVHYLLLGASSVDVVGHDGKPHEVSRLAVDLDSGLGLIEVKDGVAVSPNQILTVHYLLLGASSVDVVGHDGKPHEVSRLAVDLDSGLGLIEVKDSSLHPARLAREPVLPGLPVFLLTHAEPGERRGATGHVSSVGEFEAFWEYMLDDAIITTAINPGLAGAPLFDREARVVGIVALNLSGVARYTLAVPVGHFLAHREEMERGDQARAVPPRAWVGLYVHREEGGVVVVGVVATGPADRAGIARGDVIVSVDGEPISTLREFYGALWRRRPGAAVGLKVLRESSIQLIEVAAGDRYDFYQ